MMLDLLCGGLLAGVTGDDIGDMYDDWSRPQRVSHLFVAIDPAAFLGQAAFLALVAQFADRVHGLPAADGFDRVQLPGEVEETARARAERDGLQLADTVVRDLEALSVSSASPRPFPPKPYRSPLPAPVEGVPMSVPCVVHPPKAAPSEELLSRLRVLSTSLVSDVFGRWAGAPGIMPVTGLAPGQVVVGTRTHRPDAPRRQPGRPQGGRSRGARRGPGRRGRRRQRPRDPRWPARRLRRPQGTDRAGRRRRGPRPDRTPRCRASGLRDRRLPPGPLQGRTRRDPGAGRDRRPRRPRRRPGDGGRGRYRRHSTRPDRRGDRRPRGEARARNRNARRSRREPGTGPGSTARSSWNHRPKQPTGRYLGRPASRSTSKVLGPANSPQFADNPQELAVRVRSRGWSERVRRWVGRHRRIPQNHRRSETPPRQTGLRRAPDHDGRGPGGFVRRFCGILQDRHSPWWAPG